MCCIESWTWSNDRWMLWINMRMSETLNVLSGPYILIVVLKRQTVVPYNSWQSQMFNVIRFRILLQLNEFLITAQHELAKYFRKKVAINLEHFLEVSVYFVNCEATFKDQTEALIQTMNRIQMIQDFFKTIFNKMFLIVSILLSLITLKLI